MQTEERVYSLRFLPCLKKQHFFVSSHFIKYFCAIDII